MRPAAFAALAPLLLAACATAGGETRGDLGEQLAADGYVEELYVSAPAGETVEPRFIAALNQTLKDELRKCAKGETPLRVDVSVTGTKRPNPLKSALLTDTSEIRSNVKIYDLTTAEAVGDYTITRSTRGGLGAGGALMMQIMSGNQMREGLANEICIRAFGTELGALRREAEDEAAGAPETRGEELAF